MKFKPAPPIVVIEELMRQYGIRPSKQRGQNFLIDEFVYDTIIETANLDEKDTVLEIGPGLGTLTSYLENEAKHVVAVELDNKLANLLQDRFTDSQRVEIVNQDILDVAVKDLGIKQPYKVVANIPYNITSPIFKKFLVDDDQPTSMTLLVQQEIGERITAKPGQMSILAISVQLYSEPSYVVKVPAEAFKPAPKVDSCLVHLKKIRRFPYTDIDERLFWQVVKVGFSSKRKKLSNNLISGLKLDSDHIAEALKALELKTTVRAQELSLENWHQLTKKLLDVIK